MEQETSPSNSWLVYTQCNDLMMLQAEIISRLRYQVKPLDCLAGLGYRVGVSVMLKIVCIVQGSWAEGLWDKLVSVLQLKGVLLHDVL